MKRKNILWILILIVLFGAALKANNTHSTQKHGAIWYKVEGNAVLYVKNSDGFNYYDYAFQLRPISIENGNGTVRLDYTGDKDFFYRIGDSVFINSDSVPMYSNYVQHLADSVYKENTIRRAWTLMQHNSDTLFSAYKIHS